MTSRIGSGSPPPTLPELDNAQPATAKPEVKASAPQRRELRDELVLGARTTIASDPQPHQIQDAPPEELQSLLTALQATELGPKPQITGAEALRLTVEKARAEELLNTPIDARDVATLSSLAELLQKDPTLAGLGNAVNALLAAGQSGFFGGGDLLPDPTGAGKAIADELKKLLPSITASDLKALKEELKALTNAALGRLTPDAMKALENVFGPLPLPVMQHLARLSPTTLYMLGALAKAERGTAKSMGSAPNTTSSSTGAKSSAPASSSTSAQTTTSADELDDADLIAMMKSLPPITLPLPERKPMRGSLEDLVQRGLGTGMDIETLVMIVMAQIRNGNRADLEETIKEMEALRQKRDKAKAFKRELERAQLEAKQALQAEYKARTTPGHPQFIDPAKVSFDDFAAEQALVDKSNPPLAGPPSDLEFASDPTFGFAIAPEHASFPEGASDSESSGGQGPGSVGSDEGSGNSDVPGSVGAEQGSGSVGGPGSVGGGQENRSPEQVLADRFGVSVAVIRELQDFLRAVSGERGNVDALLLGEPPFGPGLVDGQGAQNKQRIRAFVTSVQLAPTYGTTPGSGPSVNDVKNALDVDSDRYSVRTTSAGSGTPRGNELYTQDAAAASQVISDWAASQGLNTAQLDELLRSWFIAVHNKARAGGHDPKSRTWFQPIEDFLKTLPVAQRDEYVQYIELRTAEFRRDLSLAEEYEDMNSRGGGAVRPDAAYYGVFLGARANELKETQSQTQTYEDQLDEAGDVLTGYLRPRDPIMQICDSGTDFETFGRVIELSGRFKDALPRELRDALPSGGNDGKRVQIFQALAKAGLLDNLFNDAAAIAPAMGMGALGMPGAGAFTAMGAASITQEQIDAFAAKSMDELRQSKISQGLFGEAIEERKDVLAALDAPTTSGILDRITGGAPQKGKVDRSFGLRMTDAPSGSGQASGGRLHLADIQVAIDSWKDAIDSSNELSEQVQLRLQLQMDRFTQCQTMLSNMMKKMADAAQSIIQNLK